MRYVNDSSSVIFCIALSLKVKYGSSQFPPIFYLNQQFFNLQKHFLKQFVKKFFKKRLLFAFLFPRKFIGVKRVLAYLPLKLSPVIYDDVTLEVRWVSALCHYEYAWSTVIFHWLNLFLKKKNGDLYRACVCNTIWDAHD